jgi:hypothetical protein
MRVLCAGCRLPISRDVPSFPRLGTMRARANPSGNGRLSSPDATDQRHLPGEGGAFIVDGSSPLMLYQPKQRRPIASQGRPFYVVRYLARTGHDLTAGDSPRGARVGVRSLVPQRARSSRAPDSEGPNGKRDNTKAARFRSGFLSEVIGWAPRGLRTQWRL